MGQIVLPPTGSIYVDTNTLIYRVEQVDSYLSAAAPLWDALDAGQREVATSELTLLEVLVKPLQTADQKLGRLVPPGPHQNNRAALPTG